MKSIMLRLLSPLGALFLEAGAYQEFLNGRRIAAQANADPTLEQNIARYLKDLPPSERNKIAGNAASENYTYLAHPCLQTRYQYLARLFKKASCRNVLEIGGFLTPLDGFFDQAQFFPDLYINIDPTATLRVNASGKIRAHVPLRWQSFADFASKVPQISDKQWDCVVMLGLYDVHMPTNSKDKFVLQQIFAHAKVVALEATVAQGGPGIPCAMAKHDLNEMVQVARGILGSSVHTQIHWQCPEPVGVYRARDMELLSYADTLRGEDFQVDEATQADAGPGVIGAPVVETGK